MSQLLDKFSFKLYNSRGLKVYFKYRKSGKVLHKALLLYGSVLDSNARVHRIDSC
jgi:hypothetical protein